MERTAHEKQQHRDRVDAILNTLAEEIGKHYGWPNHSPPGRYVALGQSISDLCELPSHDEWFDGAKDAFVKWMAVHHYDMKPPKS